jgi:hypothetical protein
MMFISSKTCRLFLVLAAACNAVTSAKEAEVELSEDHHHRALRGNSPTTTTAGTTPVESLAQAAHSRMLTSTGFSIQAGASIVFTHPPTEIHSGNVCAFGAITGNLVTEYKFSPNSGSSIETNSEACDPTAGTGTSTDLSLYYIHQAKLAEQEEEATKVIDAELGGRTLGPGTYYSASLTMATNTNLTLNGTDTGDFHFISGSTMVTGANTNVLLTNDATSQRIKWTTTAAATLGLLSDVKGSIVAGAAITLGEGARVSGCILALAAVNLGEACDINYDNVDSLSQSLIVA